MSIFADTIHQHLIIHHLNYIRNMAQNITNNNIEELIASGKVVVIDFSASWCGPCKRLAPIIDKLAKEYEEQAIIGKVDIEEEEDLAMKYGIRNIPTVIFIKDGEVADKHTGVGKLNEYEDKLNALL